MIKLPLRNITRLLIKAKEKEDRKEAWDLYVAVYPNMNKETYIPFDEVYQPGKRVKTVEKTEEEILKDVKEILDTFNERK